MDLSPEEVRVLGCLLEKQRTTPDAYPLSLNALRLACNQSTNRDPVVDYDEPRSARRCERLERRGITRLASGAGSRAAKFRHLLADALPLDGAEQAIVCVLMLRGRPDAGRAQAARRAHARLRRPRRGARRRSSGWASASSWRGCSAVPARRRSATRSCSARTPRPTARQRRRRPSRAAPRRELQPRLAPDAPAGRRRSALAAAGAAVDARTERRVAELLRRVERLEREVAELRAAMRDPMS